MRKIDLASSAQLAGCTLEIIEEWSGEKVLSFQTGEEPERLQKLQLSDSGQERIYILRETEPAPGYVTAEDLYFKLEQAGTKKKASRKRRKCISCRRENGFPPRIIHW